VGSDFKHAGQDAWAVWTSPFDARASDWLTAAAVIGAGAAVMPIDDDIDAWAVRDSSSRLFRLLKPFRKGGTFFQGKTLLPVVAVVMLTGYATNDQKLRDGLFGCAASWGANNILRHQVLYRFINRTRPNPVKEQIYLEPPATQRDGPQYDFALSTGDTAWGMNSYPGGHVANLTACTGFLNTRFEMGAAEPVLYALATGVGIGRIADRAHWASDQIVGAVFGYAIGREVAQRQLRRAEDRGRERERERAPLATAMPRSQHPGLYLIADPVGRMGLG